MGTSEMYRIAKKVMIAGLFLGIM
ncbi:uncharacterized protein METZ01_LOCUS320695 [marine metagenome]|uniref:Uncharacterized protein n=1 Tax=marine metagenome TaxID=408172 RepID=A0A382P7L8_9ZZZZ